MISHKGIIIKVKVLLIILVIFSFLEACSLENTSSSVPIESRVRKLVETTCTSSASCKIKLSQATDFEWDEFYFFDVNVEEGKISQVLGFDYNSSSPKFSRKWIFLKDSKLVHAEEDQISEIDRPIEVGDIDFDSDSQENKYGHFKDEVVFEATMLPVDKGHYFRLRCLNCK